MSSNRHSKSTWIEAGTAALITSGSNALKAEPLAKHLGTTKGSFYWHFTDVPTYHQVIIDQWRTKALREMVSQLTTEGPTNKRLQAFGERVLADHADTAMRAWAKTNSYAKQAIQEIDEQRLTYISNILVPLGISNQAFTLACYGTLIGAPNIDTDITPQQAFAALIDLVLALK